ncbi:arginine deiminase-related protein [uncultured Legionella sp.]|uniref:arginine deiminase-related protein n=1 Tax=uncultured Legionella sp. TaxID=210934 RepID=UPI0026251008|nr:arginine deiminase-related protein [uncultured Legionella sp.]
MSVTSSVLMVPPHTFQFNQETSASNSFQSTLSISNAADLALFEFNNMVDTLRNEGVNVLILNQDKILPDAVFPNNWFSTHLDDKGNTFVIIYPMLAVNRQAEVTIDGLNQVLSNTKIKVHQIIDLRTNEHEILEGTGSLVLDRANKLLYAARSNRTSANIVEKVARLLEYQPIIFNSFDEDEHPVYHTNVVLSIAPKYVIICLDSIKDKAQRSVLLKSFQLTNKTVINISHAQVRHMCGNVLELVNIHGEHLLILSSRAMHSFNKEQLNIIRCYSRLVSVNIDTIETIGGGSARCMMAEIFASVR